MILMIYLITMILATGQLKIIFITINKISYTNHN